MRSLTSGSIAVYDALEEFYSLNGHSPGIPWICERVGFVKSTVAHHLNRLEQAGWIIRERKKTHTIVPIKYPRVHYVDRAVGLHAVEPYDEHAVTDDDADRLTASGDARTVSYTADVRCPICNRVGCDAPHRDLHAQRLAERIANRSVNHADDYADLDPRR